jgi:AraC-like DNA-binding protein
MVALNKRSPGMGAAVTCIIFEYVRKSQLNEQLILADTDLTIAELSVGLCDVSLAQEMQIIRNVLPHYTDAFLLGFNIGRQYSLASLGMLGMAMLTSQNLATASQVASRYLLNTEHLTQVGLSIHNGEFIITFDCQADFTLQERKFLIGREFGIVAAITNQLMKNGSQHAQRIELEFDVVASAELLANVFACEIKTNCQKNQVVVDAALLIRPMPMNNNFVAGFCEAQCNLPKSIDESELSIKLRERIHTHLPQVLGLNEIAAEMHMSTRTFSRLLAKENISWRDYLTMCRLEFAEQLLDQGMSIKQVAERAGFSSSSSLSHSFSRLRGISPGEYVKQKSA